MKKGKNLLHKILLIVILLVLIGSVQCYAVTYKYSADNPPPGALYDPTSTPWNGKGVPLDGQGILDANGKIDSTVIQALTRKEVQNRIRATIRTCEIAVSAVDTANEGMTKESYYTILNRIQTQFSGDATVVLLLTENVSADMVAATRILSGLYPAVRVLLGVGVWILSFWSGISTLIDFVFLSSPALQRKTVANSGRNGNVGADGMNKPKWVSIEALSALTDSTNSVGQKGTFKSAIPIYLGRRWLVLVCLSLSIFMVFSPKFVTMASILVSNLLSGGLEMIGIN